MYVTIGSDTGGLRRVLPYERVQSCCCSCLAGIHLPPFRVLFLTSKINLIHSRHFFRRVITLARTVLEDASFIASCLVGKSKRFLLQCGYDDRLFTTPVTESQIRMHLASRKESIFISLFLDDTIVGSCELSCTSSGNKTVCTLMRFIIVEKFRGQGIGSTSLAKITDYVQNTLHANVFRLFVYAFNENAVSCYEKNGFKKIESYSRDDGNSVYRMEVKLTA